MTVIELRDLLDEVIEGGGGEQEILVPSGTGGYYSPNDVEYGYKYDAVTID